MTGALDAAELLPGKTQRGRRVAGWVAAGLDTRLHIRQEDHVPGHLDAINLGGLRPHFSSAAKLSEKVRPRHLKGTRNLRSGLHTSTAFKSG